MIPWFDQLYELLRNENPHWFWPALVGAVISALIGPLAAPLFRILIYPFRRLKHHWIEGQWHHHFFNFDGPNVLFKTEVWKIRKGFRYPLVVKCKPCNDCEPVYIGHAHFEKEFIIFTLSAKEHDEAVYQRFPTPIPSGLNTQLVGVSIAQDYSGRASAGANVISREQLTEEKVREILSKRILQNNTARIMRVRSR